MSAERQIFEYIVNTAYLQDDPDAQLKLAGEMNRALSEVITRGVSKPSEYFELYRSTNGNFYWYVMINTPNFRRWIVTDISKVDISNIIGDIKEKKRKKAFGGVPKDKDSVKLSGKAKLARKAKVLKKIVKRSDIRCKEIIECVNTINGVNIYEWRWLDVPKTPSHLVGCTGVGVIAQELLQSFPECVIEDSDGWLSVDYDMLYSII